MTVMCTVRPEGNRQTPCREPHCKGEAGLPLAAQLRIPHQSVGRLIGFANPLDDLLRLGRILQLDADGPVDAESLNLTQIRGEIDDATTRRQVAVDFAVAIAHMNVDRLPF